VSAPRALAMCRQLRFRFSVIACFNCGIRAGSKKQRFDSLTKSGRIISLRIYLASAGREIPIRRAATREEMIRFGSCICQLAALSTNVATVSKYDGIPSHLNSGNSQNSENLPAQLGRNRAEISEFGVDELHGKDFAFGRLL
jgi:hypothetical protein